MIQSNDLSRLVADIKSGNCALVLGPDIFRIGGLPLQTHVKTELLNRFGDQIAAFYERDGFFLLKDSGDKPEMQDEVKFIYQAIQPDRELLLRIIQIPFSLVLSGNPDTWLRDLSFESGLPNRFNWFGNREDFVMPDAGEADPTALRERIPLYYNLNGCIDRPSTLVLDYDDLFRLLEGMLGAPKLPEKLLARLKNTTSYLFLGFSFDRWHTQLLLRLLDVKNAARRFAIQSPLPAEKDTEAFLLNHFRIKFLGDETRLLELVFEAFEAENLLRPISKSGGDGAKSVIQFLQNGRLDKAIERLLTVAADGPFFSQAVLLSARFQNWKLEKEKGTADSRDLAVQFNQISDSVLAITNQL